MTVPFFIEDITDIRKPLIEVPQYIVEYCDEFTLNADQTSLRYYDCIWMNLGYYGNPPLKPIFK